MKLDKGLVAFLSLIGGLADAASRDINDIMEVTKKAKRFNLHEHLMTPTSLEVANGIENSRRLAKNAMRLGIDNKLHRKLVADNPPKKLVDRFDQGAPKPSEGPRLPLDKEIDALPLGDGPGVKPGLPEATREFWLEGGDPTKMWEVVACPVADVAGFKFNPLSCVFGQSSTFGIADFFMDVGDEALNALFDDALKPLIVDAITQITGLKIADKVFDLACDAIKKVEDVFDFHRALDILAEIFGSGDFMKALDLVLNFDLPELTEKFKDLVEKTLKSIDDIQAPIDAIREVVDGITGKVDDVLGNAVGTPIKVIKDAVDDVKRRVDGVLEKLGSRRNLLQEADEEELKRMLLTKHIEESLGDNKAILSKVLGTTIDESEHLAALIIEESAQLEETIIANSEHQNNQIVEGTIAAKDALFAIEKTLSQKIDDMQCPVPPSKPPKAFLSESQKKKAIEAAKKKINDSNDVSVDDKTIEGIMEQLIDGMNQQGDSYDKRLYDWVKDQSELSEMHDSVMEELDGNHKGTLDQIARDVATDAINRKLENRASSNFQLSEACDNLSDLIFDRINDVIENAVNTVIGGLQKVFTPVAEFRDRVQANPFLNLVLRFFKTIDPFSDDGPLRGLYNIQQGIIDSLLKVFLFGCAFGDECKAELPSEKNDVLSVGETRDGRLYLTTGCDSNFETELVYMKPVLAALSLIFEQLGEIMPDINANAGGEAGVEVEVEVGVSVAVEGSIGASGGGSLTFEGGAELKLKIPFVILKVLLDFVSIIHGHLEDVCAVIDSYVMLAEVEATFENTRHALKELACRKADNGTFDTYLLKRGYGCDGLDNTCDKDKEIDECEEDIFPPEFTLGGSQDCTTEHFQSEIEAVNCVKGIISASDDCKPVKLDVSISEGSGTCTPVVTATATAQGCNDRPDHDISEMDFNVAVDDEAPKVSCTIGNTMKGSPEPGNFEPGKFGGNLNYNMRGPPGKLEDALFSVSIEDNCSSSLDLKIKVLSNEQDGDGDMALIAFSSAGDPVIYLRNDYCKGSDFKCQISTPGKNSKSREYVVIVTAVDKAGNVGEARCNIFVGNNKAEGNPLFDLVSTEYTMNLV